MKIGVFGDSFAADNKMNPTDSWVDVVRSEFEVDNYGESGSNLFFSVTKFKEHAEKYDTAIFIITAPGRIKLVDNIPVWDENKRHIGGYSTIKHTIVEAKQRGNFQTFLMALQAVHGFYNYIQNDLYDNYVHNLMLEDIKKIHHNTIFIPAFNNSSSEEINACLCDIHTKENRNFGFEYVSKHYNDIRNCHMTAENNLILGNQIIDCLKLKKEFNLSIDEFVTPNNKEFYLKKL